jgi:predicted Rossmann-fold nucleotide-binding protein
MYDSSYWKGFLDWLKEYSLARDLVSVEDFDLLRVCDTPDEVIETVQKWYIRQEIVGKKALVK